VLNKFGEIVYCGSAKDFEIENPILWDTENPYLYKLIVETECDSYDLKFGIRKVEVTANEFLLNGKPVYFKGFGLHEDFLMSGKGKNSPLNIRTFELIKWINANSIRTSHYPYSEEIMDLADEYGVLVIDEVPAVGLAKGCFNENKVTDKTRELHKELVRQLVARDKNHPCVVMYSLANEPATCEPNSRAYFEDVFACARSVTDLPVTYVNNALDPQLCVDFCDVICVNRYYGWYSECQDVSAIEGKLTKAIKHFRELGGEKPLIVTEFGADTIEGNHSLPADLFTEEYQFEFIQEYCKVFDSFDYCIGEHVWNFSDFKTMPSLGRVKGNRKGIFTNERQPKMAAHYFRNRWS
jgi:beta-glucuronidase